jgi:glycosyltransferase involved in cell wall biosynthesis
MNYSGLRKMQQCPSSLDEKKCGQKARLRILVLCTYIYPPYAAGAEIHAYYVSNKLAENGHYVHVFSVAPRKRVVSDAKILFEQSLVKVWRRPFSILFYVCKIFLFAYLLRKEFDVIQVHIANTPMIPAFLLSKITNKPYVVTCHGSEIRILHRKTFVRLPQKILLLNASIVVSVSREIRDLLLKEYGLSSRSIRLIPNGYDEEFVKRFRLSAPNGVSQRNLSLVFVGSLREAKDPLNLIDVFKVVSERVKNVRLQIVGDGPLRQAVERKIEYYGLQDQVILNGAVSHQRALEILASSAIYVSTSVEEGFPTALIEAMALGKAVVVTSVGGVPEIVIDGINGLLTPPRLPERMARSIEQLLKDPVLAEKLGKAAAESVRDFSWNNIAQEYLSIYREVVDKKQRR